MLPIFSILAFQGICIYHAYQNDADSKWFWIIGFVPIVGSAYYLYDFYSSNQVNAVDTALVAAKVNFNNQEIAKLEDAVKFADSISNNANLADKYLEMERFEDAIALYEKCMNRFQDDDDSEFWLKLVDANFSIKNYDKVIFYGEKLANDRDFEDSEERICLAWAYYYTGNISKAEENFKGMNQSLTNYTHRVQYAYFLKESGLKDDAMGQLNLLLNEYHQMKPEVKNLKKDIFQLINSAKLEISRS